LYLLFAGGGEFYGLLCLSLRDELYCLSLDVVLTQGTENLYKDDGRVSSGLLLTIRLRRFSGDAGRVGGSKYKPDKGATSLCVSLLDDHSRRSARGTSIHLDAE
jgi:hypothetical protein